MMDFINKKKGGPSKRITTQNVGVECSGVVTELSKQSACVVPSVCLLSIYFSPTDLCCAFSAFSQLTFSYRLVLCILCLSPDSIGRLWCWRCHLPSTTCGSPRSSTRISLPACSRSCSSTDVKNKAAKKERLFNKEKAESESEGQWSVKTDG